MLNFFLEKEIINFKKSKFYFNKKMWKKNSYSQTPNWKRKRWEKDESDNSDIDIESSEEEEEEMEYNNDKYIMLHIIISKEQYELNKNILNKISEEIDEEDIFYVGDEESDDEATQKIDYDGK